MIVNANALHLPFASGIAQTVVTSPPYYGKRDYGTGEWIGGSVECPHSPSATRLNRGVMTSGLDSGKKTTGHQQEGYKGSCPKCGAVRIDKQIGLEENPAEYVANIVDVFREVWRVLRDDGTAWINLGDSYAGGNGNGGIGPASKMQTANRGSYHGQKVGMGDAKPKDLLGIPWRVAFALQDDGWYLRSDIIWNKPNAMPESVTDRPTSSHEHLFLLSKTAQYFYDADAIREPSSFGSGKAGGDRTSRNSFKRGYSSRPDGLVPGNDYNPHRPERPDDSWDISSRNKRDVWTIPTKPCNIPHFATYPEKLVEPCILAGSKPGDLVLDPFNGSGTTGRVALRLGRRYAGTELNPEYIALNPARLTVQPYLLGALA